jgi:hypothetical protein
MDNDAARTLPLEKWNKGAEKAEERASPLLWSALLFNCCLFVNFGINARRNLLRCATEGWTGRLPELCFGQLAFALNDGVLF